MVLTPFKFYGVVERQITNARPLIQVTFESHSWLHLPQLPHGVVCLPVVARWHDPTLAHNTPNEYQYQVCLWSDNCCSVVGKVRCAFLAAANAAPDYRTETNRSGNEGEQRGTSSRGGDDGGEAEQESRRECCSVVGKVRCAFLAAANAAPDYRTEPKWQ